MSAPTRLSWNYLASRRGYRGLCIHEDSLKRKKIARRSFHIGGGNLFRGYLAGLMEEVWKPGSVVVIGAHDSSSAVAKAIAEQDWLFSVTLSFGGGIRRTYVNGAIAFFPQVAADMEKKELLLASFANPTLAMLSLSVTDKAYQAVERKELNLDDDDVRRDLKHLARQYAPHSVIGWIVSALHTRYIYDMPPLPVVPFENAENWGDVVKRLTLQMAKELYKDRRFEQYIRRTPFLNVVVDRIAPGRSDWLDGYLQGRFDMIDKAAVLAEAHAECWASCSRSLLQHVPNIAGVKFVPQGQLNRLYKCKRLLLNGAHFTTALLGHASKISTIDETISLGQAERFVREVQELFWKSVLKKPKEVSLEDYSAQVRNRFKNHDLRDDVSRVSRRSISKVREFFIEPWQSRTFSEEQVMPMVETVALWLHLLSKHPALPHVVFEHDPEQEQEKLTALATRLVGTKAKSAGEFRELLEQTGVLAPLAADEGVVLALRTQLDRLSERGMKAYL